MKIAVRVMGITVLLIGIAMVAPLSLFILNAVAFLVTGSGFLEEWNGIGAKEAISNLFGATAIGAIGLIAIAQGCVLIERGAIP